jgi:probable HAF family extracellular repeat protein
MSPLASLPSGNSSAANSINSGAEIVGWGNNSSVNQRPVLWENGSPTDLGALPTGNSGEASHINDMGQIVGWSDNNSSSQRAVLWTPTGPIDLGSIGAPSSQAQALSINNGGDIVGWSQDANGEHRAILWSGGQLYDLNNLIPMNSGWTLLEARDINERGWIVGFGRNPTNGDIHAFLATPEPSSWLIFGTGAALVIPFTWSRMRKRDSARK